MRKPFPHSRTLRPVPLVAAFSIALLAGALSVLLVAHDGAAQVPEKPQPCLGDIVLGGDTNGDGADDTAIEIHVATGQDAGTWGAFTSTNPSQWLPDERAVPIAEFGTCSKDSRWALRTYSGEDETYHYDGTNPLTGGGDGINGYLVSGPTATTSAGAPAAETVYQIDNGQDKLQVTTTLALHGTTRQDTLVRMSYEVCNMNAGPARVGLKNYVAAQAGPVPADAWGRPYDEYGDGIEDDWSQDEERYTDFSTAAAHDMSAKGDGIHVTSLLRDHDGFNAPSGAQGRLDPTTPDAFYFWGAPQLAPAFDPPAGAGAKLQNGDIAWFWGPNQSTPVQLAAAGADGACATFHAYLGVDLAPIVPPRLAPGNDEPVASFTADTSFATCDDSGVRFSAWSSSDEQDTKPKNLHWDFGDGTTWPPEGILAPFIDVNINRTKTYAQPGVYTVVLRVFDSELEMGVKQMQIQSVGDPNCPPEVTQPEPPEPQPGERIEFSVSAVDPEGDRLRYYLQGAPSWITVHERTGRVTGTLPDENSIHAFQVCITDDQPERDPICHDLSFTIGDPPPKNSSSDADNDGIADRSDNCYLIPNTRQEDRDQDGIGDACDAADPEQEIPSTRSAPEPNELRCDPELDGDMDGDGHADPCDMDLDGDGILERGTPFLDNCPFVPNPGQQDQDDDSIGDACDGSDGLGYANLAQQGMACTGCPAPEELQEASTRTSTRGFNLVGLGLVLGFGVAGAALAFVFLGRR